jgi:hypothetical protein
MKMHVFYNKLPISAVSSEIENDVFVKEQTIQTIQSQIEGFIKF